MSVIDGDLWIDALVTLQNQNDPRELLCLIAKCAVVPEEVREQLGLWLAGKLPPEPPELSDADRKLMYAMVVYERERRKDPRISQDKLAERVAGQKKVPKEEILQYLEGKSAAYKHIQRACRAAGGLHPLAKGRTPITDGPKPLRKAYRKGTTPTA